jgi:hypothetical protein
MGFTGDPRTGFRLQIYQTTSDKIPPQRPQLANAWWEIDNISAGSWRDSHFPGSC